MVEATVMDKILSALEEILRWRNDLEEKIASIGDGVKKLQTKVECGTRDAGTRRTSTSGSRRPPSSSGSMSQLADDGEISSAPYQSASATAQGELVIAVLQESPIASQTTSVPLPAPSCTESTASLRTPLYKERVILTTYPGQVGIRPVPMNWGDADPEKRGPVIASRHPSTLRVRNAIGAYGGSYCIYRALAVAIGDLPPTHKPDFHNTEPPIAIGPHATWGHPSRIVSLDPFGHIAISCFGKYVEAGYDVRPTIAITKAHMMLPEIKAAVASGKLTVDGKVVCTPEGELNVVKAAVEPVWYLPGVANRFGIDESTLRRALFEDTGGMYPELITRTDLKVFLPPIGGLTVYIFGNPRNIPDESKRLTLRIHDECNGSDVFGSDVCTCRPYLLYGIEECVKEAQRGGSGVVVYFRKEGRALGEVTKYLVYNARKRAEHGDTAADYFRRTECIAGVKDMRFQALMPDVLNWLGIKKVDRMISMSNMKYDAIVGAGIPIHERVDIPAELIPADSHVEIEAKIASGYFTTGHIPSAEELEQTKGRTWDDILH